MITNTPSQGSSRRIDNREGNRSLSLSKRTIFPLISLTIIALFYSGFLILDANQIETLTKEDGLVESIGALALLASSIIFIRLFYDVDGEKDLLSFKTRKNFFFITFGILFLIGFFEEISWGQRILNVDTPRFFNLINSQHEINFHNLIFFHGNDPHGFRKDNFGLLLNPDRLFSIFWLLYCILIPFGVKSSRYISNFFNRIRLPLVTIEVGICFLINYIVFKSIENAIVQELQHNLVEIKETIFEILFLIIAVMFWFIRRKGRAENVMSST